ncbi:MAG: alcohol dehydrogenase catalytic domain-containing protein [Anaerolineaceae bacterium]|jgi:NADPH:quinone reductase-like Zn-dependent oxidoreductase|nr:alcohol dehydrogenase catalytic domain-containing protein [Anaerolineaceae bacterium]MDD4043391.1 alcohol dehydrogenase catalytic domain-containing protein [Anaerolineaceae bacterium]
MKAIVLKKYGSTNDLELTEIPKPVIGDDEVLIRLLYTSLNAADLDFVHGHPLIRFTGLRKPGFPILGSDLVGIIDENWRDVTGFEVGELVWADTSNPAAYGTFAEYVKVKPAIIQKLPAGIPLPDAACLPTAAIVA